MRISTDRVWKIKKFVENKEGGKREFTIRVTLIFSIVST